MQITLLLNSVSNESIKAVASRYTLPIFEMMKKKIGLPFNETTTENYGDAKMILFSSHDLQLSFIMKTLAPTNYNLTYVEFASNLFYELHKEDSIVCAEKNAAD
mmetsp:Transcript_5301/g.6307  ORF Transcript_5301/g.6307 Transcript_5301/m.6307 type:complete len:104 (-) Transcript_5301:250-561(-)